MTRKMPVKTAPMDLEQDGYPGFIAQVRTNLPSGYLRYVLAMQENGLTEAAANEIFLKMFPGWDFVDDDGKAIPHTRKGMESIPDDIFAAMWNRRGDIVQEAVMPAPLESESSTEKE